MNRKIVDYRIIETESHYGLVEVVKEYLEEGWELFQGSYAFNVDNCGPQYYQAMVKYENI